jgi:hypothetical protein
MSTVLWQPEVNPPPEWLFPAILYEEKISTIAPPIDTGYKSVRVIDSLLSKFQQLQDCLGNLYVPANIRTHFLSDYEKELIQDALHKTVRDLRSKRQSETITKWLSIVDLRSEQEGLTTSVPVGEAAARDNLEILNSRRSDVVEPPEILNIREEINSLRSQIEETEILIYEIKVRLARERKEAKKSRQSAQKEYAAQLKKFNQESNSRSNSTDAEAREKLAILKNLIRAGNTVSKVLPSQEDYDLRQSQLQELVRQEKSAEADIVAIINSLESNRKILEEIGRRELLNKRWEEDSERLRHIRRNLGRISHELSSTLFDDLDSGSSDSQWDFMFGSKINDEVMTYLIKEAGFIHIENDASKWVRFIFAPKQLMRSVLQILATGHCVEAGWIPMHGANNIDKDFLTTAGNIDTSIVAKAALSDFLFSLPIHIEGTSLKDVVKFREEHESDCKQAIDYLQSVTMKTLGTEDDLQTQKQEIIDGLEKSTLAVRKALESQGKRASVNTRRYFRDRTRVDGDLRSALSLALLNSLAAEGGAELFGGGLQQPITKLHLSVVTLSLILGGAKNEIVAASRHLKIKNEPVAYLYDVARAFDS